MTLSDIKDLLAAGFTHDEIMQLNNPQNPQDNPQNPQDNPQEQPDPSPDPEEKQPDPDTNPESNPQEPAAQTAPAEDKLNQLTGQIDQLIRTIQASNLQNNFVDSARKADLNQQVDDIMKSIIRPEKEESK